MAAAKQVIRRVKSARQERAAPAVSKRAAPQASKAVAEQKKEKPKSAWAILRDKRAKERWEWEEYNRIHHITNEPYPGTKEFWVQWRANKAAKQAEQMKADAAATARIKAQMAATKS